ESALTQLTHIFDYEPSEKISIVMQDISDYGSAAATAIPHNTIRLGISPLEVGYENIPYTEGLRWMLSHELVHIVVNDMASGLESFSRSVFSKVPPEKEQPLSIIFSLLTGYGRYTPNWHQEGVATFMETWLNGGFGRGLGNFDEMFFRSMVVERKAFPTPFSLVAKESNDSFLLNTLNYLYGTRFMAFLAAAYDVDAVLAWFTRNKDEFYNGYATRFKQVFGSDLSTAWRFFLASETRFQARNLKALMSRPLTPITSLQKKAMGWVTQPFLDRTGTRIVFGNHQAHNLTALNLFDIRRKRLMQIGTLPTPSLIRIASTAYDRTLNNFFYTTKNNQLYRDLWVLNLSSGRKKRLFKSARVGDLAVSPENHVLWGVRHLNGKVILVTSNPPYKTLMPLIEFEFGDVLNGLSISPSGKFLAATLHQSDGSQSIIVAEVAALRKGGPLKYRVISSDGSPEFPSWSPNESYLYWNAFTNGVSNIYRYHFRSSNVEAMSHTLRGLFRPVYFNESVLFAFEFTSNGFQPVFIPNKPAEYLPAIQYFGQKTVDRNPQVGQWALQTDRVSENSSNGISKHTYSGLANLRFNSVFPTISGFQNQKIVGLYTHFSDPILTHDFILEAGYNPFSSNSALPRFHFRGKYQYKNSMGIEIGYNAPNFYDLFNDRKAGMIGAKVSLEHTHYWKFDNPHKIKQTTELTLFKDVEAIKDNTIVVDSPDFLTFETVLNSKNVRRAIGSIAGESGYEWNITLAGLLLRPEEPRGVVGLQIELGRFMIVGWPHNIFHIKVASGYTYNPDDLAIGKLYFGGFGNRELENKEVRQYREMLRFPGRAIYSMAANSFAKIMLEQTLPPLKFGGVNVGQHFLERLDASIYSQGLIRDSSMENALINLGVQVNLVFKHWFNLDSTFSAGVAQAWSENGTFREWFLSYKLFRD
ncbi:MAG: TolB family protein, partial [bacterium]